MRKVGLVAVLAAAAIAGSALGGGLLSAGAATNPTTPSSTHQTAPPDNTPRHHCHHGQGQDAPIQQGSQSDSSLGSPAES